MRQKYDDFSSLTFSSQVGDVETVRNLLRKGLDVNGVNYDGRSALAMVC